MGDAEDRSKAPLLLAHPLLLSGCSKEPSSEAKQSGREARSSPPHNDGVQSTGFSHTVEFSRSLVEIVPGDSPCGSRSGPVAGAAATLSRAFQVRQPSDLSPLEVPRSAHRLTLAVPLGPAPKRQLPRGPAIDPTVGRPPVFPGSRSLRYLLSASSRHPMGHEHPRYARTVDSGPTPVVPPGAFGATSPSALHTEEPSRAPAPSRHQDGHLQPSDLDPVGSR
jgi:hypothetical protein